MNPSTSIPLDLESLAQSVQQAVADGKLAPSAAQNITRWLTDDAYAAYAPQVAAAIQQRQWKTLDDVFWTVIPFGTGGRRGRMHPFGSNAINDRTIGESAQGLAAHVKQTKPAGPWSCAIAYDTRHRSREFAELCAGIMVANDFDVFFIDDYRSTPELSFLIRYKNCDCGIMVTASHNPPSDNAVKVYWSNGAQLVPPHDQDVIDQVMQVKQFAVSDFGRAVAAGKIHLCTAEVDAALLQEHLQHSIDGPRDLRIIFSPLHGVGEFNVKSLLNAVGFEHLEIYEPHRQPSGDFPNVPGHVSNPENPAVFREIIQHAQNTGAELILASDPDCDRMGAAAPTTMDPRGPWQTINGNQLGVLLADFILAERQAAGSLQPSNFVVTTLVTTLMIKRICDHYGIRCFYKNLVGFKWICHVIDEQGPPDFVFGTEESHGYLVGTYARDKDGAIACMLMSQLAAQCKSQNLTLFEKLDRLYLRHGYHAEQLLTVRMEGSDGMRRMQSLMGKLRQGGLDVIGDLKISGICDYQSLQRLAADGTSESIAGPVGNLIVLETEQPGNYVAVRPSGTEPKVKMYMFTFVPPDAISDLDSTRLAMQQRLASLQRDLETFAGSIE